jgi:hypothetical protein
LKRHLKASKHTPLHPVAPLCKFIDNLAKLWVEF